MIFFRGGSIPWAAVLLVCACRLGIAEQTGDEVKYEREGDWKPLFVGVEGLNLTVSEPRKMKAYAARIQLDAPGLSFVSTPDNGEKPDETDGIYTSTFLKQQKCQLAINAGAFGPVTDLEGGGKDIKGLHIADGRLVSPWEKSYDAVLIDRDNRTRIVSEPPDEVDDVQTAVSGFRIVLRGGELLKADKSIHPRTLLGISKDGKVMFWLVIDGRQPGISEGATTYEAAVLLKDLGAHEGINLDGGGTSTLVIESPEGNAKVINRPIHRAIPGLERPGASHLGVRTRKLEP